MVHGFGVAGERTWATPELTGVGRLPMRSPLVPFPDVETARSDERESSPWWRSLDGRWWFCRVARPELAPGDFAAPDLDPSSGDWRPIEVPGSWVLQGWDGPIYTNIRMPFEGRPPEVPDDNPTGLYRTAFSLPQTWSGRRIVLHVGGAESVLYAYVNGVPVGMGKDSHLPSEFDITEHVRPGANTLACMVVRWSDASYIEDQDQWWQGGIHRSVYCYTTDSTHVADVQVDAGLDADDLSTGTLEVRITVGFADPGEIGPGWRAEAMLETLAGEPVLDAPLVGDVPHDLRPYLFWGHVARLAARVPAVAPWSAEEPNLYRMVVSLVDPSGRVREVVAQRVGFRRVEVRDNELLVNGRPVMIHGVNRHDHDPYAGRTVTLDAMRTDLVMMKRFNFNALRCSHYPNDSRFLDLCDELGMYVVDEADVESHAFNTSLCDDPRYLAAFVDRGSRMVRRDKNHASVIAWSLGNESGYGPAHDAMAGWIRRYDPTRPLHYEGALTFDMHADAPVTDIVCPMYPAVDAIVEWATSGRDTRRPLIMCEYSHAMGNSNGGLADYFAAFEAHHGLQGGFIWEWKDHGLAATKPDGRPYFAYGGQFGDEPNDANFVADGLCGPDGTPHPAMWEHKYLAAPVAVTASDNDLRRRKVRVTNRQWFRDLSWLRANWELAIDGVVRQDGALAIPPVDPRETVAMQVPFERPQIVGAQEVTLTFRFTTAAGSPWADEGHEVAWCQLAVPIPAKARARQRDAGERHVVEIDRDRVGGHALITAGKLEVALDEATGEIGALRWAGHELLASPPRIDLWRAPTDNDGIKCFIDRDDVWSDESSKPLGRWLAWGLNRLHRAPVGANVRARDDGGLVVVSRHKVWGRDPAVVVTHRQRLTVLATGDLVFDEQIVVPSALDDLPRVGISFGVVAGFERLVWLGSGPLEAYPDRCAGSILGRWERTVTDEYVPYTMPQEHGTHVGTRWFSLEHAGDRQVPGGRPRTGLLVASGGTEPVAFSAGHFEADDLFRALDVTELVARPEVVVHVDAAHRGLGTLSCGPDTAPEFKVGPGTYRWRWRIRPYDPRGEDPGELGRGALAGIAEP